MLKLLSRCLRKLFHFVVLLLEILAIPAVFLLCCLFRLLPKRIDIGLGPLPMINNVHWAKALRKKGYTTETFTQGLYYITDEFDFVCDKEHNRLYANSPILLFLRTAKRYSCIYLYFNGGPLMSKKIYCRLEPFLYKVAGVKLVVMPYGSDCQIFERTPNKHTVNNLCLDYPKFFKKNHKRVIEQVERWTCHADVVIGSMDSIDYLFYWDRIIPCHFAIDTDRIRPDSSYIRQEGKIRILHAPNHMSIKGTEYVERAIARLISEGYDIEYRRIQKMSNEAVIEAIKHSDIIIDQLVMGWYAMFAMEAMACGKTCICYLREDLLDTFEKTGCLEREDMPLVSASVRSIYDVLKNLLDNPKQLDDIGKKSRLYVEKYQSLDVIGDFLTEINQSIGIYAKN